MSDSNMNPLLQQLLQSGQDSDASGSKKCHHPSYFGLICTQCKQRVKDRSAIRFRYIHEKLRISTKEINRIRESEFQKMLAKKKLYLVLDLDHTLVHSTSLSNLSSKEEHLLSQSYPSDGSVFVSESKHLLIKLRPFVQKFLREASSMYEMYVYTMADRSYAENVARLLDPERKYFESKVISRKDCTEDYKKGLDVLLAAESAVVILDDTESVWSKHRYNLIRMKRYIYFSKSRSRRGQRSRSLCAKEEDESWSDSALAKALEVLKLVHQKFFEVGVDPRKNDVRKLLKNIQGEAVRDCDEGNGCMSSILYLLDLLCCDL